MLLKLTALTCKRRYSEVVEGSSKFGGTISSEREVRGSDKRPKGLLPNDCSVMRLKLDAIEDEMRLKMRCD